MKLVVTNKQSNRSLLLIFAGWGMDSTVFADIAVEGFDTAVVWDYRDPSLDAAILRDYTEIVVIAWSMGVWFADRFIKANPALRITRCVAVNGTLTPVDDLRGIPAEIYDKTSLLPDAGSVARFMRRICGGASAMKQLLPAPPQRPVDELREELVAIRRHIAAAPADTDPSVWDEIFISGADLIFPPANMYRAWEAAAARVVSLEGAAHIVDFAALAARVTLNKTRIGANFGRASGSYTDAAGMQADVARALLADALAEGFLTADADLLEIGSGTGVLTDLYQPYFTGSRFHLVDLAIDRLDITIDPRNACDITCGDAETVIRRMPDAAFDVVFSSSTLQWFHSPLKFLREVRRVLRPGGRAFIAYFAPGTLQPLADEGLGLRYPAIDDADLRALGFTARTVDRAYTLAFDTPAALLRHFRATGVNGTASTPLPPARLHRLLRTLRPSPDAPYRLTYIARFLILS